MQRGLSRGILGLVLLGLAWNPAGAKNTPGLSAPDNEMIYRGDLSGGHVNADCLHGTSGSTTVTMPAGCQGYALDSTDRLVYAEAPGTVSLTYSGGDNTYWLALRANEQATPGGWTCKGQYCWIASATRPVQPAGTLIIQSSTVVGGAITAVVSEAPRRVTKSMSVSTMTTGPYAPWIFETPGAVITVNPGATLTLGSCPQAGAWQIFEAMGGGSGTVAFTPYACHTMPVEWWGADPTGVSDSTLRFRRALLASKDTAPVSCAGNYLLSATEPNQALTLTGGEHLIGKRPVMVPGNPAATVLPCRLTFVGTGRAIGTTTTSESKSNIRLENLFVYDRDSSGSYGFDFTWARSMVIENIMVHGFATGAWIGQGFYYGSVRGLKLYEGRTFCLDMSGAATNGILIEFGCNSRSTTMTAGFRLGIAPGLFGTANQVILRGLIEVDSGNPVIVANVQGLDASFYVEHPGVFGNYATTGAVQIVRVQGGRLDVRLDGSSLGGGGNVNEGLRLVASGASGTNTSNLTITGNIRDYVAPLRIDQDEGSWGIDITGLDYDATINPTVGQWVNGLALGENILTHGNAPGADNGRGSTAKGTGWYVGDVIWAGSSQLNNTLRLVTTAGNPPTMQVLILPTTSAVTFADGDATPTVKTSQVFHTRATAVASATAITNIDDGQSGQCLTIRAAGDRTITDNANILLNGGVNFAMNDGDMLILCLDGVVWREAGRSDNN